MWTPKGRAKSVHISELSTVVDTLSCGHLEYSMDITNNQPVFTPLVAFYKSVSKVSTSQLS